MNKANLQGKVPKSSAHDEGRLTNPSTQKGGVCTCCLDTHSPLDLHTHPYVSHEHRIHTTPPDAHFPLLSEQGMTFNDFKNGQAKYMAPPIMRAEAALLVAEIASHKGDKSEISSPEDDDNSFSFHSKVEDRGLSQYDISNRKFEVRTNAVDSKTVEIVYRDIEVGFVNKNRSFRSDVPPNRALFIEEDHICERDAGNLLHSEWRHCAPKRGGYPSNIKGFDSLKHALSMLSQSNEEQAGNEVVYVYVAADRDKVVIKILKSYWEENQIDRTSYMKCFERVLGISPKDWLVVPFEHSAVREDLFNSYSYKSGFFSFAFVGSNDKLYTKCCLKMTGEDDTLDESFFDSDLIWRRRIHSVREQ